MQHQPTPDELVATFRDENVAADKLTETGAKARIWPAN